MQQTFTRIIFYMWIVLVPAAVKGQRVLANDTNNNRADQPQPVSINFTLKQDSYITLNIFDPLGNQVLQLAKGKYKAGDYNIPVDSSSLRGGVYFYRLSVNDRAETKKITIRK